MNYLNETKETVERHHKYRMKLREQREQIRKLQTAVFCMVFVSLLCMISSIFCIKNYIPTKTMLNHVSSELEEIKTEYVALYNTYENMYDDYIEMTEYKLECEETIQGLNEVVTELDEQNKSLVASNEEYYQTIQIYEQREELFDKYEYAIKRTDGSRTDITYDQLLNVETLSEEKKVDTDLVLSIAMVESNGKEKATNAESTARGYGQFLAATARFVYEDIMEAGTYSHEMAFNGNINFKMMVNYLDHLDSIHHDLIASIRNYRGEGGDILIGYISKIDGFLSNKGKSIEKLNM